MPPLNQKPGTARISRKVLILAILSTVLVLLTLVAWYLGTSNICLVFFYISSTVIFALLFHLYLATRRSPYSQQLRSARVHLLAHFVPFAFFVAPASEIRPSWFNPVMTALLFLFFLSGRKTWMVLESLFPSTRLYHIFYRANSAFMVSIPLLYLACLVIPEVVTFVLIEKIALFYFSIHFLILGVSSLKLESDLQDRLV